MIQINILFDQLPAPIQAVPPAQLHSPTSVEAAEAIAPTARTARERVFRFIAACPRGATDEQIQDGLSMNPSTQRPRRVELCKAGNIWAAPDTRSTRSGRQATVWCAFPY